MSLWLAGIAVNAVYLAVLRLQLAKQISKESRSNIPPVVLWLVRDCKRRLGITKSIKIVMQSAIRTPALAVTFQPLLLLNSNMIERYNEQELRCSIMHELMHYKRRDPWVCILLNILRSIYWFNPAVWLAYRQMKMDMETACDAMVVKTMGFNEKQKYAEVILSMFTGNNKAEQLTLGMAMKNNRATAERRIRGVFMRSRTLMGTRAMAAITAFLLLFACFTTGCQPVADRVESGFPISPAATVTPLPTAAIALAATTETTLANTPVPTAKPLIKFSAPETLKQSFPSKDGMVLVNIDAAVNIPEVEKYPVVNVEPVEISTDMVKAVAGAMMEGQPVYEPQLQLTKSEIDKEIKDIQFALDNPKQSKSDGLNADPATVKDTVSMFKRRIQRLQSLYNTAPEVYTRNLADIVFHPATYYDNPIWAGDDLHDSGWQKYQATRQKIKQLDLYADLSKGYFAQLSATNYANQNTLGHTIVFQKSTTLSGKLIRDPSPAALQDQTLAMTITNEQAIQIAEKALHDMGIADMVFTRINPSTFSIPLPDSEIRKIVIEQNKNLSDKEIQERIFLLKSSGDPVASTGQIILVSYNLTFKKFIHGVPTDPWDVGWKVIPKKQKVIQWIEPEDIAMTVDDSGITYFNWQSPMKETELVTDDAKLLPFEKIIGIFQKQMAQLYDIGILSRSSPENADYKEEIKRLDKGFINITNISLGMARIQVKDQPGKYQMVPVWSFHGGEWLRYKTDKSTDAETLAKASGWYGMVGSYMTINAIDGSLVYNERN